MKTHAFRLHTFGDESVLDWEEVELGELGPGQVLIRHTAVGVNFADIYMRQGHFHHQPKLPTGLGLEGAGVIEAIGPDVRDFSVGQRVGYAGGGTVGSYAQARLRSTDGLIALPDWMDDKVAAAAFSKGMTVQYLFNRTHKLAQGDVILFTAAAGGVGLIAGQWAKALGATVIGTAGSKAKIDLALANGYDHVIDYGKEDFAARVRELTDGAGVDVVYDSVGKDTFPKSLDCLKPRGLFVSFGNASGPVEAFNLGLLSQKGSLYATRPTLFAYIATRAALDACANSLFDVVQSNKVRINIHQTYPLADAGRAHTDLEARRTSGTTLLIP